jgi:phosphatidylglycerophosphatase A
MAQNISKVSFRHVLAKPIHFFAFGFGLGLVPRAPGTFGTLPALPLYWWIQDWPLGDYLLLVVGLFIVGVGICHITAKNLGIEDPASVVWDEIVGFLVAMTAAPKGWEWLLAGFVLFRVFDIWKPWPIRMLDHRLQGGLGIMVDDAVAGVFAALVLAGLSAWFI